MEDGLREILKEYYSVMMKNITEPKVLASSIKVLTPLDHDRIASESRERGDSTGVFELLNRLQKRGPQAFPQLLEALKIHGYGEIANTLEERAVRENLYRPIRQASTEDKKPISRGPWVDRSLSQPVQPSSVNYGASDEMHSSKSDPTLSDIDIPNPDDLPIVEEVNPQQMKKKKNEGKETLLKDIPSHTKDRIVAMLSVEAALGRDWKGIAGEIQLTAEQQGEIGSLNSPMGELFKLMAYKEYRVINIINILKKLERQDVITVIAEAGYYSPNQEEPKAEAASSSPVSPLEVSETGTSIDSSKELGKGEKTASNSAMNVPSPTQVSEKCSSGGSTKKLDENNETAQSSSFDLPSPSQVSDENKRTAHRSPVDLPSSNRLSEFSTSNRSTKELDEKKEPHCSQEVEDGKDEEQFESDQLADMTPVEEDVFFPDNVQGKAMFVSCEKYTEITKLSKLNLIIKQLSRELDDCSWQVTWKKDCTSAKMRGDVDLKDIQRTDVCFVYLAGHTLQINGENYLLPIDIELASATADIVDSSLNINKLVKQLSELALMVMVIVDGAHFNENAFECPVALTGLTSIIPPSNTVIAFPCQPGYVRPQEERLLYLKAFITAVKKEERVTPTTLFALVKEALKESNSPPVVFSLSRSLLPIYLNVSEEDEEGITIQKPTQDTPRRALVFSDRTVEIFKQTVEAGTGHLEASLNQLGWHVEMFVNIGPNEIKRKVRESLKGLREDTMNIVMLYFMGYVTKDNDSFGKESRSPQKDAPTISIHWLVNMMSQYVTGPKIVIVDDPSLPVRHELKALTALPQEVLLCLPKQNWTGRQERDSFTLLLSQNLAACPQSSLKNIIETSARRWRHHHVNSKLFYA